MHTTCTKNGSIRIFLEFVSSCWMGDMASKQLHTSNYIRERQHQHQHFFHLHRVNKREWTACVGLRGYERRYQPARYEIDLGSSCSARRIAQTTGSILVKWWPLKCVKPWLFEPPEGLQSKAILPTLHWCVVSGILSEALLVLVLA